MGDGGAIGELTGACGFRSTALGSTKEKDQKIEGATVDSPDPSGEERKSGGLGRKRNGPCGWTSQRNENGPTGQMERKKNLFFS